MTWTTTELSDVRSGLSADAERLEREVLGHVRPDTTLGPHDELDVATIHIESFQDSAQAENSAAILAQTLRVIARIDAGQYGACETCGDDIGRARLEAFPRALACMPCTAASGTR